MAVSLSALREAFKNELSDEQLGDLKGTYESFVKGNPAERAAAEAIAQNVNNALALYVQGTLTKDQLLFTLKHAYNGYQALIDARVLRIRRTALRVLFNTIQAWVLTLI